MKTKLILIAVLAMAMSGCADNQIDYSTRVNKANLVYDNASLSVYKITVDSVDYLLVDRANGGTAIIKHDPK